MTSGEWKIDLEHDVVDSKGNVIANIPWSKEYEANAKLIAAAPDLLEACKKAIVLISEMHQKLRSEEKKGDPMHVYPIITDQILEQAIKKATKS